MLLHLCPSPKQSLFVLLLRGVNSKDFFVILLHLLFFHSSPYLYIQQNHTISFLPSCPKQLWENQKHKRIFLYPKQNRNGRHCQGPFLEHQHRLAQFHQPKPVSWLTQANKKKTPQDYKKVRAEKYAQYFKGNRILPILELVEAVQPKTLSLIVTYKNQATGGLEKGQI